MSAPTLSWDIMLKVTKTRVELISDIDMCLSFEKTMTGGVSYISKKYSKVNSQYLNYYDSKQESKHITYLDTNNLYGYAFSKFLPKGELK